MIKQIFFSICIKIISMVIKFVGQVYLNNEVRMRWLFRTTQLSLNTNGFIQPPVLRDLTTVAWLLPDKDPKLCP